MRTLKKIFSRFSIIALTIILIFILNFAIVFGAVYVLGLVLSEMFPNASSIIRGITVAIAWIIVALTVLNIVNRNMVPEAKVPWLIVVLLMNVFGVAIYAVFSHNRPTKLQRKRYRMLDACSRAYLNSPTQNQLLGQQMGHFSDVSTALCKEDPNSCVSVAGDVCYLSSGDAFFDRLKEDCEQAKSYIFLEFFIIDRGIMWDELREILCRKVKEGVEVRLIYDDIGSMSRVRSGYYKYLRKLGIKCVKFAPFVPVVTNVHNNRDHRKIAVIDGQVAYTGGINIADEYINVIKPFGVWKDSAVRLTGDAVRSLTLMFLQTYDYCTRRTEDFSPYLTHPVEREEDVELAKERGLVQVYGAGPSPIYSRSVGEDVYLNLINSAKKYIYITSPYLIIDYRLKEALVRAAMRGVDVRIVTPHIPDKRIPFALTRSNYRPLMSGGVKIYEYAEGFVHGKNMLVDDTIGVVGSINLDYRSFLHHFECAALLYGVSALGDLKKDFEETFQTAIEQGEHTVKQNAFSRLVCEVAKIFAPLF